MIKYILTMFVFGTFLMADDSQQYTKPTPTITINDDSEVCARKRSGKGNKGRRRGGNGLR